MATFRDKVATVTLVYGATSITETEFDIPLILTGHNVTNNVVDIYTSADDILSAGFSEASPAYKMATLLFEGLMPPEEVIIGKRDITSTSFVPVVANSSEYVITLKQGRTTKKFSFTSDADATAQEIAVGVADLINADTKWSKLVTVSESDSKLNIQPVEGSGVDVGFSDNFSSTTTYANSITEDITAVAEVNNTWFYILADSHADADVKALSSYAETNDKFYFWSSQDVDVRDATEGDTLSDLIDLGYNNTCFALWKSDADLTFPEASVVGQIASATPGTTTLHGKTLVGVELEKLTTTQESNIVAKNGNIYRKEHGLLFYCDGFVVSGLYVDYIIHSLWFKARVEESLVTLFKQQSMLGGGVRATSSGIELIRQAVMVNPIQVGITNGSIATEITTSSESGLKINLAPTVYIPSRADMTQAQIDSRYVEGMKIEYVYAGFFHRVKVQVNVLTNRTATNSTSNSTTVA